MSPVSGTSVVTWGIIDDSSQKASSTGALVVQTDTSTAGIWYTATDGSPPEERPKATFTTLSLLGKT
jgi:hypothetical protein